MSISAVGSAVKTTMGTGGGVIALPTVAVGDIIDLWMTWGHATTKPSTLTDDLGGGGGAANAYVELAGAYLSDGGNGQSSGVYRCIVTTAGTPTVTANGLGGINFIKMVGRVLRGAAITGTVPDQASALKQTTAAGVAFGPGSFTPSADGAWILSDCQDSSNGSVTITPKSGATVLFNDGVADGTASQEETQATAGSYSATFTFSAVRTSMSQARAYVPLASGAVTGDITGAAEAAAAVSGTQRTTGTVADGAEAAATAAATMRITGAVAASVEAGSTETALVRLVSAVAAAAEAGAAVAATERITGTVASGEEAFADLARAAGPVVGDITSASEAAATLAAALRLTAATTTGAEASAAATAALRITGTVTAVVEAGADGAAAERLSAVVTAEAEARAAATAAIRLVAAVAGAAEAFSAAVSVSGWLGGGGAHPLQLLFDSSSSLLSFDEMPRTLAIDPMTKFLDLEP